MFNFLLTASSASANGGGNANNWIAMAVGTVIILGAIAVIYFTTKNKENGETMLKEFFELMASRIKKAILEAIKKINPEDLNGNIAEVYFEITKAIYDAVYDMCYEYIDTIVIDHKNIIAEVVKKALTKEKVQEYVDTILDNNKDLQAKITEIINIVIKSDVEKIEEEDRKRTEELKELGVIEDMDEYIAEGNDYNRGKEPAEQLGADFKPIKEEINPPKDEEDEVVKDDGTIEIVDSINVVDELNDDNDDDDDGDDGK